MKEIIVYVNHCFIATLTLQLLIESITKPLSAYKSSTKWTLKPVDIKNTCDFSCDLLLTRKQSFVCYCITICAMYIYIHIAFVSIMLWLPSGFNPSQLHCLKILYFLETIKYLNVPVLKSYACHFMRWKFVFLHIYETYFTPYIIFDLLKLCSFIIAISSGMQEHIVAQITNVYCFCYRYWQIRHNGTPLFQNLLVDHEFTAITVQIQDWVRYSKSHVWKKVELRFLLQENDRWLDLTPFMRTDNKPTSVGVSTFYLSTWLLIITTMAYYWCQ